MGKNDVKEKFKRWLLNVHVMKNGKRYSLTTVQRYLSALYVIKDKFNIDFFALDELSEINRVSEYLFKTDDFIKKNEKGKHMYSCAVQCYISFIRERNFIIDVENIKKVELDNSLSFQEKNSYIETICNMRNPSFQSNFRKELIHEFDGKCALCDINDERLLIASHIVPYSECKLKSDMYHSYNGLLLCIMHDALFDKYLITFDKDRKIIISNSIAPGLYDFLGINSSIYLSEEYFNDERIICLNEHRRVFKSKND